LGFATGFEKLLQKNLARAFKRYRHGRKNHLKAASILLLMHCSAEVCSIANQ
jgi:hypothetical protein